MATLIKSNCLIEAIKLKIKHPKGKIGLDSNSPSGISFYFDYQGVRYRFRRKIKRKGNKNLIYFIGYRVTENLKVNEQNH